MCGISGLAFKVAPSTFGMEQGVIERLVDNLLLGIEHRGKHSTGVVSARGRKTRMDKAPKDATTFVKTRRRLMDDPMFVLLHTRFATQGDPKINLNNHPVRYDSTYIVHNGHISNDDELFKDEDMYRHAQVDSEAIAAMFHKFGLEKAHLAAQKLQGGFATAVINPRQFPNQIVIAKGESSPCVIFENEVMVAWASVTTALDEAFEAVFLAKPSASSLTHLKAGDIFMMKDGVSEMLNFQVNYKFYQSSYSRSNWSGNSHTPYSAGTHEWRNKKCLTCGCERYWHGEMDLTGICRNVHGRMANTKPCTCKKFVPLSADIPKTITTGSSGPGFSSPLRTGHFQVHTTSAGKRIVREIKPNGGTISYGVCDHCKYAYEMDGLLYVYEYGVCSNCYKPSDGEMMPDSILAPEVVQLMIGEIYEEQEEDMEISMSDIVEDDILRHAVIETLRDRSKKFDNSEPRDANGINSIIIEIEDEIFGAIEDLTILDDFREEAISDVAQELRIDENLVDWVLFQVNDDDLLHPDTLALFDEVINQYETSLKELVNADLYGDNGDWPASGSEDDTEVGMCGVKAWDA